MEQLELKTNHLPCQHAHLGRATAMIRQKPAVRTLARELTIAEIAVQYGVSPATIYRRLPS
ncbi:MAG: hypothetical protein DLM68_14770 [Hyphomicrobiales bacterium]|nr:MAG: hypothetical protein DLM68_14770 [Hyphomicrobiales bacterium]